MVAGSLQHHRNPRASALARHLPGDSARYEGPLLRNAELKIWPLPKGGSRLVGQANIEEISNKKQLLARTLVNCFISLALLASVLCED